MAKFCSNCGYALGENDKVCANCGTPVMGLAEAADAGKKRSVDIKGLFKGNSHKGIVKIISIIIAKSRCSE